MSKKTYALIATLTSAAAAAAVGLVTYFNPSCAAAINASIPIAEGAIIAICGNFVTDTIVSKKK